MGPGYFVGTGFLFILWVTLSEQCGVADMSTDGRFRLCVSRYRGSKFANVSLLRPSNTSARELVFGNWPSPADSVPSIFGETMGVKDGLLDRGSGVDCSDGSELDGSDDVGDLWTIGGVPLWKGVCFAMAGGLRGVTFPSAMAEARATDATEGSTGTGIISG